MKKSLLLLSLVLLFGCQDDVKEGQSFGKYNEYRLIIIDECEYIGYYSSGKGIVSVAHKGNCKNPIHIYSKSSGQELNTTVIGNANEVLIGSYK